MSTFLGLVSEIPGISVDRFDEDNLLSSAFFLSHCHTDHMVGLDNAFFEMLEKDKKYLYCSPISKILLERVLCFKTEYVREINVNEPTYVELEVGFDSTSTICVTCISAGHCPGSVMFFFEKDNTSVLYTGDFRINPKDFPKLKLLHNAECADLRPRRFDKIYLDTTFLSRDFLHFPTRDESSSRICQISREWLRKDQNNVVVLECSARFGAEYLFMELSKLLNLKVHVKDHVYQALCSVKELSFHITSDAYSTPLHACGAKTTRSRLNCRPGIDITNILTVIPSAMKWKGKDTSQVGEWDKVRERTFNVCYSMHSSFNELHAFIQYFNPTEVFPCVCRDEQKEEVYSLLREIQQKPQQLDHDYTLTIPKKKQRQDSFKSEYFSDDSSSS